MSRDLLAPRSYGRAVTQITALWALAHGMEYSLVTCDLRPRAPLMQPHWSKPRALLAALRQPHLDYVLMIDADAAVRDPAVGMQQLLRGPQGWLLSIACSTTAPLPRPESRQACSVNSGVVLVRSDLRARGIVQWWATLGEGSCPPDTQFAEQDCAQMAVERSLESVQLHSPHALNAPLWLGPDVKSARVVRNRGNFTYCASKVLRGRPHWEPLSLDEYGGACWRNKRAFVCHGYGFLSVAKVGNLTRHRKMFASAVQRLLASHWPTLRKLLAERGEEPDSLRTAISERIDQLSLSNGSECGQVAE